MEILLFLNPLALEHKNFYFRIFNNVHLFLEM